MRVVYLRKRLQQDALWGEGSPAGTVFCSEQCSAGKPSYGCLLGIHMDVTLTCTYFNIPTLRLLQMTYTPPLQWCVSFSRIMHSATLQKNFWNGLKNLTKFKVAMASKFPRSQSDWLSTSVGCAGTNLIHGGPMSQLAGFKRSSANVLVSDTKGILWVHASIHQSCFGSTNGGIYDIRYVILM